MKIKKMLKKKKAMTAGFLVTLIIVILSFMMISGTIFRFLSNTKDKDAEILCHDSVAFRASSALGVLGTDLKYAPLICKTLDQKIKPEGGTLEEQKEDVQKKLADKMARCWWMFGEGRYEGSIFNNIPFLQKSKCFMCYVLIVDEGSKFKAETNAVTPREFDIFLSATESRRLNSTYLNYFQFGGQSGKGQGIVLNSFVNDNNHGIKPSRAYAVVYRGKADICKGIICDLMQAKGALHQFENIPFYELYTGLIPIDSIMLVEMNSENANKMRSQCTLVEDTAGK